MPSVDTGLAQFSNLLLVSAIVLYAFAMLGYACDLAFGKRAGASNAVTPAVVGTAAPARVAVGAGISDLSFPADPRDPSQLADLAGTAAPGANGGTAGVLPEPPARQPAWPRGTWLRVAFALTCAGLVSHAGAVLTRGLAEHRVPWGNMYEFIAAITCTAVLVLVLAAVRLRVHFMGLFVMVPVVLALAADVVIIYTPAGQVMPALQSYWIAIHVTAMIIAIGTYTFGAVVTVLYLLSARSARRAAAGRPSRIAGIIEQLPGPEALDRLAYRSILFAFPAWTFAVIAGAIWANEAWGRYWGWDPKETWSFITLVVYAAYLHARATAGWRGERAARIQLVGFACLMFNLVGINLWISGMHSYAGLPH